MVIDTRIHRPRNDGVSSNSDYQPLTPEEAKALFPREFAKASAVEHYFYLNSDGQLLWNRKSCPSHPSKLLVSLRFRWPFISFYWTQSICLCEISEILGQLQRT
jgi:hypothetical protein